MERLKLIDLYQQRQKERREKGQGQHHKRFRINPDGDIHLMLYFYSEERGISARNLNTGGVKDFPCGLLVIPEEE